MARRRRKILGIPVAKAKRSSSMATIARVGAVGAAALAAIPAAQRGRHVVDEGQELIGKAGDALGTATDIRDAVSSHRTTVGKAVGLIGAVAKGGGGKDDGDVTPRLAHLIEEHTDISVPRSVAYNQWTQMELFPSVVKGVSAVDQLRDDRTEWTSKIGPVRRRWKARIVEQVPDERIAWRSESGPELRGVVTFHSLSDDLTRVLVQIHYVPHGPLETVGNKLRIQRRRVRRDLRLFKHFLELRGTETGAWRGRIGENSADRQGPHPANGKNRSADAHRSAAQNRASTSRSSRGRASNGRSAGRSTSRTPSREVAK